MNQKLLIPKDFRFMGKDQQTLYKEAMAKKNQPVAQQKEPKNIIPPKSFGNVVPLIGSDKKTTDFTVMEGLQEARKQGKLLSAMPAADEYVLQNSGYWWTGVFFSYPNENEKFGSEILYTDGNGVNYLLKIPKEFQPLKGKALWLNDGVHADCQPYFEFNEDKKLWVASFNKPDDLIQSGLLAAIEMPRSDGWRLTDAQMFPNGAESNEKDKNARYLWQYGGNYVGLLRRGDGDGRRGVSAGRWPSCRHGVLVYE